MLPGFPHLRAPVGLCTLTFDWDGAGLPASEGVEVGTAQLTTARARSHTEPDWKHQTGETPSPPVSWLLPSNMRLWVRKTSSKSEDGSRIRIIFVIIFLPRADIRLVR